MWTPGLMPCVEEEEEEEAMEESLDHRNSLAAPLIFTVVISFQFISVWLELSKKRGLRSAEDDKLRGEIKQLLKEASAFSQPSTFAQAAKLRRMAAAKEKELLKNQESLNREKKSSYDSYLKALLFLKVFFYFVLVCWYWSSPVAAISKQLVQPFGKVLSWRSGVSSNDNVMCWGHLSEFFMGWGNGLHQVSGNHKQQNNLIDAQTSCQELDLLYEFCIGAGH
ncbi:hypothetical protein CK203_088045 [Vitis vinifera]|uniref:Uncharacterized protein n=1 Tax=Vitis vinifera TaxID=29760 RepID=A0A438DBU1_VITVI|nr:hypothetical protein CK203_088045 [Vitis vinifera]